jgi:hypothetical protein
VLASSESPRQIWLREKEEDGGKEGRCFFFKKTTFNPVEFKGRFLLLLFIQREIK